MKKLIGIFILGFFALGVIAQSAHADGTTITFNGSYASDSDFSLFSVSDENFSISFNVPSTLTSVFGSGFSANTLISFNSPEFSDALPAVIIFNPTSDGGLFQIDATTNEFGEDVSLGWVLFGQQLYTLNSAGTAATLIPNGVFNIVPSADIFSGGSFFFDTLGDQAPISSGTVTLASGVPEPPALYLLICGCLALAIVKLRFLPS